MHGSVSFCSYSNYTALPTRLLWSLSETMGRHSKRISPPGPEPTRMAMSATFVCPSRSGILIPRVQYEANATSISILPTILDLLINTSSLNRKDMTIASDLLHDYEGQSLIRPYKSSRNGRRAWNFGVINSGASMLSVTSADAPWRFVIPLDRASQWRFTDLKNDPLELEPLEKWSMEQLVGDVRNLYGEEASH